MVGFGNIAQAHLAAYHTLEKEGKDIKLVALCDIDPSKYLSRSQAGSPGYIPDGESGSIEGIHCYDHMDKMADNEELDMVDICVPTYRHAECAIHMLERGYHVLSEKPMARTYGDCLKMIDAAKKNNRYLMIGQCVRFYPEFRYMKQAIDDGRFGKVLSARFERIFGGATKAKGGNKTWFADYNLSGGGMLDLHIHDIDLTRYLFGNPTAVCSTGIGFNTKFDCVDSKLMYADGKVVSAAADWSLCKGISFTATARVACEEATMIYSGGKLTVYQRDGSIIDDIAPRDGITSEIDYLTDIIAKGEPNRLNPPESAAETVRLVEMLARSAEDGGARLDFPEKMF